MVVKYCNQNYSKLKRDHQRRGELFTDPEFAPTNASLFISGKSNEEIVWKRPGVSACTLYTSLSTNVSLYRKFVLMVLVQSLLLMDLAAVISIRAI